MPVEGAKPTVTIEAREILRQAIPKAAKVLIKMLDATDEKLRLRASEAVLALAGIVHDSSHSVTALDLKRDKWEREAAEREIAKDQEQISDSDGFGDLPCPKCAGSVNPSGGTEGPCPHCAAPLRLALLEAIPKAEA